MILDKVAEKIFLFTDIMCITDYVILGNLTINKKVNGEFKINLHENSHIHITLSSPKLPLKNIKKLKESSPDIICMKSKRIHSRKRIPYLGNDKEFVDLVIHHIVMMSHEIDYLLIENDQ